MKILFLTLGGYLGIVGLTWAFQDRLMFFPDTTPMEQCSDIDHGQGLIHSDDSARFYEIPTGITSKGMVIYFHGNGGRACDRIGFLKSFLPLGYKVIVPEYPGYAENSHRPAEEDVLASALLSFDKSVSGDAGKVILFGESLGTTVATYVASERGDFVDGMILQAPFPSVQAVGQDRYFFLPVRWISNYSFPAEDWAKSVTVPVFSYHGTRDAIVPIRFGRTQIQNFSSEQKIFWEIEGAGHLNVAEFLPQDLWQRIDKFLRSL